MSFATPTPVAPDQAPPPLLNPPAPSHPPPAVPPVATPPPDPGAAERDTVERLTAGRNRVLTELARVIVGQQDVIEHLLIALFAGGHCLITGAPGLAKTLLVKSIGRIFELRFQRIQFTP